MDALPSEIWSIILRFVDLHDLSILHMVCNDMETMAREHRGIVLSQDLCSTYHVYLDRCAGENLQVLCLLGCFAYNPRCHHTDRYTRYGRFLEDLPFLLRCKDMQPILARYGLPPPLMRCAA